MTDNYQPPKHPWITGMSVGGIGDYSLIINPRGTLTPDEAISLGLALMENGLHLKKLASTLKQQEKIMDESAIDRRIKKLIVAYLGTEEAKITPGANFQDDLGADSLDAIELVMAAEEEFAIEISDEQATEIKTVGDFFALIKTLLPKYEA